MEQPHELDVVVIYAVKQGVSAYMAFTELAFCEKPLLRDGVYERGNTERI